MSRSCPRCGAENPEGAAFCHSCGQDLRTVTLLVVDLLVSRSTAAWLRPVETRELLSRFRSRLRSEVVRWGGTVWGPEGDVVVGVFEAELRYVNHPERAVRAALAIRDAAAELNEQEPALELHVKMGVDTGWSVAVGWMGILGDVRRTARRLRAAAPPDTILVGEATLSATRDVITYRKAEPVEISGRAHPLLAWELVAPERPSPTPQDLPAGDAWLGDEPAASPARVPSETRPRPVKRKRTRLRRAPVGRVRVLTRKLEHVVNSGFAGHWNAARPLSRHRTLAVGTTYLFWVEVGRPLARSIEPEQTELPVQKLPATARLVVVLFGFDGELDPDAEADVGELELTEGIVRVRRPAAEPSDVGNLAERRLFFRVRTPERPGVSRMRCNIYCEGVLVQSRLVAARIATRRVPRPFALHARLEYTLSRNLAKAHLATVPSHKLSLLLNHSSDTAHNVFVFAEGDEHGEPIYRGSASLDPHRLETAVTDARKVLRRVSWRTEVEWTPKDKYRYRDGKLDLKRLTEDLAQLAKAGYNLYDALIDPLSGGGDILPDVVRKPGLVQIALQEARFVLPAAILYDARGFDPTQKNLEAYTLCDQFRDALASLEQLDDIPCFTDSCPNAGRQLVICPSAFWGFRDAIGLPLSSTLDTPQRLPRDGGPRLTVGVATNLKRFATHERKLKQLAVEWNLAERRSQLFEVLHSRNVQMVYLYCHGGVLEGAPCIVIGEGPDGPITSSYLRGRITWPQPGPLVFINGCHTAAAEPAQIYDLIGKLIEKAHAAGVVGTEISIFEEFACRFAEEFMGRFLAGVQVGWAVRAARLRLLESGNPLGLVYTPFVLGGLQLR